MVRYAKKEELDRVNELRKQVHMVHCSARPDIFRRDFCPELQKRLFEFFDDENCRVIVALRDDTVCGFAVAVYISRPETPYSCARKIYHVEEFGVDEAFRRKGVGTELVGFLKSDAAENGFCSIELDVWEFNDSAAAFYEALGFKTYRRFLELTL